MVSPLGWKNKVKFENWPQWLKGLVLFFPTILPSYLFLRLIWVLSTMEGNGSGTTSNGEESFILPEVVDVFTSWMCMTTLFIGMVSLVLTAIGFVWMFTPFLSMSYRKYLIYTQGKELVKKKKKNLKKNKPVLKKAD